MVPGRPSPTKDFNRSTTVKANSNPSTSFEKYQKSVSDAWTLSEDELTKEYCILSDETKIARRANQNIARALKNPIAVVHRHHQPNITVSATTSTANTQPIVVEEEIEKEAAPTKVEPRKVSSEYG